MSILWSAIGLSNIKEEIKNNPQPKNHCINIRRHIFNQKSNLKLSILKKQQQSVSIFSSCCKITGNFSFSSYCHMEYCTQTITILKTPDVTKLFLKICQNDLELNQVSAYVTWPANCFYLTGIFLTGNTCFSVSYQSSQTFKVLLPLNSEHFHRNKQPCTADPTNKNIVTQW